MARLVVLFCGYVVFLFVMPSAVASGDITMSQEIVTVLNNHPSIREARFSVEAAELVERVAFWQFFPTPSVSYQKVNTSKADLSYQGDGQQVVLGLYQPIWTGGRLTSSWNKSKAGVVGDMANLKLVRLNTAKLYVQAYGDWMGATLKVEALQKSLATHKRLIVLITRRIENGLSASSDLTLSQGRIGSVESSLQQAKAQLDAAVARMEQLYGGSFDVGVLHRLDSHLDFQVEDRAKMINMALSVSPEVEKSVADVRVAEAEIGIQKASYTPEVYIRAERQYGNVSYKALSDESRIFVGLSTAFGAGLSAFSQVEQANYRRAAAESKLESVKRQVTEQVVSDMTNYTSAEVQLTTLQAAYISSELVSAAWDRQFFAGRKSWLELMNAAQELAQSELAVADVKSTLMMLKWRLAIATKGLEYVLSQGQSKGEGRLTLGQSNMVVMNPQHDLISENILTQEQSKVVVMNPQHSLMFEAVLLQDPSMGRAQ